MMSTTSRCRQEAIFVPALHRVAVAAAGASPASAALAAAAGSYAVVQALDLGRAVYVNCCAGARAVAAPRLGGLVAAAPPAPGAGAGAASVPASASARGAGVACSTLLQPDACDADADEAEGVARAAAAALGGRKLVFLSWNVEPTLPEVAREAVQRALLQWLAAGADGAGSAKDGSGGSAEGAGAIAAAAR